MHAHRERASITEEYEVTLPRLGPPGLGKTQLAVGIGLKACAHGY